MFSKYFIDIPAKFGNIVGLSTDDRIAKDLIKFGVWEEDELNNCISLYKEYKKKNHKIIIDIGSNIGSYSIPFTQEFQDHEIYSIDCQQILCECLQISVNKSNITNLKVIHAAVSNICDDNFFYNMIDYDKEANFGAFELQSVGSKSDFNGTTLGQLEYVKKITIDSLNLENVGFIKIDVEGMELEVLNGAVNTINQSQPLIAVEQGKTLENDITDFFHLHNYKKVKRDRSLVYFCNE